MRGAQLEMEADGQILEAKKVSWGIET